MVWWWWILPGVVGIIGLAIVLSWPWLDVPRPALQGRARRHRWRSCFLARALSSGCLASTYKPITGSHSSVLLQRFEISQRGPHLFDAVVTEQPTEQDPNGIVHNFEMHGDEWRIEARVLKWKPWAYVLGLDSQYRLDRFSGRYADTQQEINAERSVYDIRPARQSGFRSLAGST